MIYIVRAYKKDLKTHQKLYSLIEFEAYKMETVEEVKDYVKARFKLDYERHLTY
jgi:hypothetical protein